MEKRAGTSVWHPVHVGSSGTVPVLLGHVVPTLPSSLQTTVANIVRRFGAVALTASTVLACAL